MHALIINEPRAYREVIFGTLRELRPHIKTSVLEPEDLDREMLRLHAPPLVVCSKATPMVEQNSCAWIELYPNGASHMVVGFAGERIVVADPRFDTLLSAIDGVEYLHGMGVTYLYP